MSAEMAEVLRLWQQTGQFKSRAEAATRLSLNFSTYKGYLAGNRIPAAALASLLQAMGFATIEAARAALVDLKDGEVRVYDNYTLEGERVLLNLLGKSKEVRDTRIMIPDYPIVDRQSFAAAPQRFQNQLNSITYERIRAKDLKVSKIEHINDFARLIDLLHNIKVFAPQNYHLRILRNPIEWFPYQNFMIFDDHTVLAGGFHKKGPPLDPFLVYRGAKYVAYFSRIWARLFESADAKQLHPASGSSIKDLVLPYAQKIPGHGAVTWPAIQARLKERERMLVEQKTRY